MQDSMYVLKIQGFCFTYSNKYVIIVGDGAESFYKTVCDIKSVKKSHPSREFQSAVGVGYAAIESFKNGKTISPNELLPFYLRLPQAERELKMKKENEKL